MDPKKTIKKYIMPGAFVRVGCLVFGALLVLTLAMGLLTLNAPGEAPVEFYPSETPTGTMAYIDVVGVSNWLYQYDDAVYYSVEDAQGYLYTVRLKDSQLRQMAPQEAYWNRETEAEPMPEPYHLVGYVQTTASSVKESLAQSWDLTTQEYEYYFGTLYLNATTSVGAEKSAGWFVGALVSGMFALLCGILQLRASRVAKKCLKQLEDRCLLERAAQQLDNPVDQIVIGKNRGILTQDFLFGKGTGAVVPIGDVLWAYKQEQRRNFIAVNSYLMVATAWMGAEGVVDMNRADRQGHIGDALAVIAQRNPDALLGYTNENRRTYKSLAGK